MNYLVTGGTGFIGAYVTRQLVVEGHSVTVYDLVPDVTFLRELLSPQEFERVNIVGADVTDLPRLLRAAVESRADRIIHLAALLGKKSEENPLHSLRVNCEANINVFEVALALGVKRVVWGSSVAVFGPPNKREAGEIANDAVHRPVGLYGACKSLSEHIAKFYRRSRGLDCVGLRFSLVFGYGKARTLARGTGGEFLTELIDNPTRGQKGVVPAGDAILDLIYVEDAARAAVLASQRSNTKSVALNIAGHRSRLRDVANLVAQLVPDADLVVEDGSWDGTDHNYDKAVTLNEIGFAPQISIHEGLQRNINDLRRFGKA
jgi:nucleoside-diphosphate-sugar epimerase